MSESMVTGRMDSRKKDKVARILKREGLNASQVINLLYDRIVEEDSARFLTGEEADLSAAWRNAADFIDSLSSPIKTRFDEMSSSEVRVDRLAKRGLMHHG